MNIKALLCAAAAAAVVLGCATPDPRSFMPKQCSRGSCDAEVIVDDSSGTPKISMKQNDDVLRMKKGDKDPVIFWRLNASDDYEFARDSISPHTTAPSGGKTTTTQAAWGAQISYVTSNARIFIVKNKNSASVTLYYDVKVCKVGTANCWTLDPAIMNDP